MTVARSLLVVAAFAAIGWGAAHVRSGHPAPAAAPTVVARSADALPSTARAPAAAPTAAPRLVSSLAALPTATRAARLRVPQPACLASPCLQCTMTRDILIKQGRGAEAAQLCAACRVECD